MGGEEKKSGNSYSLLQKKMREVEKSKKLNQGSLKNQISTSSSKSSLFSKVISDKNVKKSPQREKESPPDKNTNPNIPDRSYGDLYCPTCDSHMNSDAMWDAHITGKRHLKNLKKGESDSKYDDLDVESIVEHDMKNVKDVIGLSYIHEIRRKETGAPPLFNCFLCHATFASVPMVIEHVISMKHRMNYIKENAPDKFKLLDATNLRKGYLESLVEDAARDLEKEDGRGSVKVKQEKNKAIFPFTKRAHDSDDDVPRKLTKSQKVEEKKASLWKAVDDTHKWRDLKQSLYDRHSSKYGSPPPRDSSRREIYYSRTPSISPPRLSLDRRYSYSRSSDLSPPRSSRRDTVTSRTPPKEYYSHSHSHKYEKDTHLQDNSPSADTKHQKSDSRSEILKDLFKNICDLPTELFLKIVLYKLDNMQIKGMNELSLLTKVVEKANQFILNEFPSEMQTILKKKMFQNFESNSQSSVPPVIPQVPESNSRVFPQSSYTVNSLGPQLQGSEFKYIKDVLNLVKGNVDSSSSVSQNITTGQTSYQNCTPYQNSSYGNSNSEHPNSTTTSTSANYSYYNSPYNTSVNIPGLNTSNNIPVMNTSNNIPGLNTSNNIPGLNTSNNIPGLNTSNNIPGLNWTDENINTPSSYSTYYPGQSSSSYPSYGY